MIYKTKAERRQEFIQSVLATVKTKKFIVSAIVIIVLIILAKAISLPNKGNSTWVVDNDSAFLVAGVDVTSADAGTLIGLTTATHDKLYGEVEDAEAAYKIASRLLKQLYGDFTDEDYPLYICENTKANAWVVHTSPEEGEVPGVVAVNISTGEVYMIRHAL